MKEKGQKSVNRTHLRDLRVLLLNNNPLQQTHTGRTALFTTFYVAARPQVTPTTTSP
jgi:hypothetical protein